MHDTEVSPSGLGRVDGSIDVFLLDDHEIVRRGVGQLIDAQPEMQVIGQAGTAAEAIRKIRATRPPIAVLDISLETSSGIEVCREVTETVPGVACIMLTSVIDDRAIVEAEAAGAAAFCLKTVGSNDLIETIRRVAAGARLLDEVDVRLAERRLAARDDGAVDRLTHQERRIFDLIGKGCSNGQIADEMLLAEKTVKNYVSNVLSKLGMQRRTEVAALAARLDERESEWRR